MFVFGDEARESRPFGLPAVLALVAVAGASTVAIMWGPSTEASFSAGCTPGTLRAYAVKGQPYDRQEVLDAILAQDAKDCESVTADDPERARYSSSSRARAEAKSINAAVEAAICPDAAACQEPRFNTAPDVDTIRGTLVRFGYPDADVRLARHPGESPQNDLVFGVRLHAGPGCLVSFARMGQGVARMGPVGVLRDGRCLHPVI